jgi:hypothetical protein
MSLERVKPHLKLKVVKHITYTSIILTGKWINWYIVIELTSTISISTFVVSSIPT